VGLRESPHLRGLRELDLGRCRLRMRDVQRLAGAASLASVERLRLAGNRLFDTGTEALLASPHLKRLRELDLRNTQLGPRGAAALGEAASLERLRVGVNRLGDDGVRRLIGGGGLRALTHLGLGDCRVTTSAAAELLASSGLPALSHLDLSENPIDGGLFLTSPSAARRGRLHLTLETHHLPGEEAVIDSPLIAACAGLVLKAFELAEETIVRLARSACPGGLRALTLFVGAGVARVIEALGSAPHHAALRELALIGYFWDEAVSRALLAMPLLRRLRSLSLLMAQVREVPRELAARAGDLAHLERLTVSSNFLQGEARGALSEALGWRLRVG
jgi:Leucine-rich repeat (LRR) protein